MKRSLALLVSVILIIGLFASCGTTGKAAAPAGEAAVDQNTATGLYYTCKDLEGKVPEDKKNVEPWTKVFRSSQWANSSITRECTQSLFQHLDRQRNSGQVS